MREEEEGKEEREGREKGGKRGEGEEEGEGEEVREWLRGEVLGTLNVVLICEMSFSILLIADWQSEKTERFLSEREYVFKAAKIARSSPRAAEPRTRKAEILMPPEHSRPKAAAHLPVSGKKEASVHKIQSPFLWASV